jgi:hypothetical protein
MKESLTEAWFNSKNELRQWANELTLADWNGYSRKEKQFVLKMIDDCKFRERELYRKLYG